VTDTAELLSNDAQREKILGALEEAQKVSKALLKLSEAHSLGTLLG